MSSAASVAKPLEEAILEIAGDWVDDNGQAHHVSASSWTCTQKDPNGERTFKLSWEEGCGSIIRGSWRLDAITLESDGPKATTAIWRQQGGGQDDVGPTSVWHRPAPPKKPRFEADADDPTSSNRGRSLPKRAQGDAGAASSTQHSPPPSAADNDAWPALPQAQPRPQPRPNTRGRGAAARSNSRAARGGVGPTNVAGAPAPSASSRCPSRRPAEGSGLKFRVEQRLVGSVIGKKGQNLKHIMERTRVAIKVDQSSWGAGYSTVFIEPGAGASLAKRLLDEAIQEARIAENDEETKKRIESRYVGMLIGPKGANIKYIEDQSGAYLQIDNSTSSEGYSTLYFQGRQAAVAYAKELVEDCLATLREEQAQERAKRETSHEDSKEIRRASRTPEQPSSAAVGQRQSNSEPVGSSWGSSASFARVASAAATASGQSSNGPKSVASGPHRSVPASSVGQSGRNSAARQQACAEIAVLGSAERGYKIRVPQNHVGLIVGKGGQTVKALMKEASANIDIDQSTHKKGYSTVHIHGGPGAEKARELVVAKVQSTDDFAGQEDEKLVVAQEYVGTIIGPGGENIQYVKDQSGARVAFEQSTKAQGYSTLIFKGSADCIKKAKEIIDEILVAVFGESDILSSCASGGVGGHSAGGGLVQVTKRIEQRCVGSLIGHAGQTLRSIKEHTGAVASFDQSTKDRGFSTLTLSGSEDAVWWAQDMVQRRLEAVPNGNSSAKAPWKTLNPPTVARAADVARSRGSADQRGHEHASGRDQSTGDFCGAPEARPGGVHVSSSYSDAPSDEDDPPPRNMECEFDDWLQRLTARPAEEEQENQAQHKDDSEPEETEQQPQQNEHVSLPHRGVVQASGASRPAAPEAADGWDDAGSAAERSFAGDMESAADAYSDAAAGQQSQSGEEAETPAERADEESERMTSAEEHEEHMVGDRDAENRSAGHPVVEETSQKQSEQQEEAEQQEQETGGAEEVEEQDVDEEEADDAQEEQRELQQHQPQQHPHEQHAVDAFGEPSGVGETEIGQPVEDHQVVPDEDAAEEPIDDAHDYEQLTEQMRSNGDSPQPFQCAEDAVDSGYALRTPSDSDDEQANMEFGSQAQHLPFEGISGLTLPGVLPAVAGSIPGTPTAAAAAVASAGSGPGTPLSGAIPVRIPIHYLPRLWTPSGSGAESPAGAAPAVATPASPQDPLFWNDPWAAAAQGQWSQQDSWHQGVWDSDQGVWNQQRAFGGVAADSSRGRSTSRQTGASPSMWKEEDFPPFPNRGRSRQAGSIRSRHHSLSVGTVREDGAEDSRGQSRICCFFLQGRCWSGARCQWVHDRSADPLTTSCSFGADCTVGHGGSGGQHDRSQRGRSVSRDRACCFFMQGKCVHGNACYWQHPEDADPKRTICGFGKNCFLGHGRLAPGVENFGTERVPSHSRRDSRSSDRSTSRGSSQNRWSSHRWVPKVPESQPSWRREAWSSARSRSHSGSRGRRWASGAAWHGSNSRQNQASEPTVNRLLRALFGNLVGQWESVDSDGKVQSCEVVQVSSSTDARRGGGMQLQCKSRNEGSTIDDAVEMIRCEGGDILLGDSSIRCFFLDAFTENSVLWAESTSPEVRLKWVRERPRRGSQMKQQSQREDQWPMGQQQAYDQAWPMDPEATFCPANQFEQPAMAGGCGGLDSPADALRFQ